MYIAQTTTRAVGIGYHLYLSFSINKVQSAQLNKVQVHYIYIYIYSIILAYISIIYITYVK